MGALISEHGVPLLQGNTVIDHSLRLEDADIPIIAAMKSWFPRFLLIFLRTFLWQTWFADLFLIILLTVTV